MAVSCRVARFGFGLVLPEVSSMMPTASSMSFYGIDQAVYEIEIGFYDIEVGVYEIDGRVYEMASSEEQMLLLRHCRLTADAEPVRGGLLRDLVV